MKLHNRLRNILVKISYSAHTHTSTHIIVMTSHARDYKNLISQQEMPLMVDRVPTLLHMTLNFLSASFTLGSVVTTVGDVNIWKMRTDNGIGRSVVIHDQLVDGVAFVLHFPQDLTQHVTLNTR